MAMTTRSRDPLFDADTTRGDRGVGGANSLGGPPPRAPGGPPFFFLTRLGLARSPRGPGPTRTDDPSWLVGDRWKPRRELAGSRRRGPSASPLALSSSGLGSWAIFGCARCSGECGFLFHPRLRALGGSV